MKTAKLFSKTLIIALFVLIFSRLTQSQSKELAETIKSPASYSSAVSNIILEIDLSSSDLNSVPEIVFQMTSLETLDLRNNPISKLPREIRNLQNLRVLNLAGTTIEELPDELSQLRHLKEIHLKCEQWQLRLDEVKRITKARIVLE